MSEYKYTYRFSEQTVDTRYYKVESNTKLTQSEMQDLAWSVEQTEGETFTCNEGKATYEYEVIGGTICLFLLNQMSMSTTGLKFFSCMV